jgi:hypothetical protein
VLTMREVLEEAMESAVADRLADDLTEVRFGRYSDPEAGWYWIATFSRETGSHVGVAKRTPQPLRARIRMVLSAWDDECARHAGKAEN